MESTPLPHVPTHLIEPQVQSVVAAPGAAASNTTSSNIPAVSCQQGSTRNYIRFAHQHTTVNSLATTTHQQPPSTSAGGTCQRDFISASALVEATS